MLIFGGCLRVQWTPTRQLRRCQRCDHAERVRPLPRSQRPPSRRRHRWPPGL